MLQYNDREIQNRLLTFQEHLLEPMDYSML
jgi:hypothetical protein